MRNDIVWCAAGYEDEAAELVSRPDLEERIGRGLMNHMGGTRICYARCPIPDETWYRSNHGAYIMRNYLGSANMPISAYDNGPKGMLLRIRDMCESIRVLRWNEPELDGDAYVPMPAIVVATLKDEYIAEMEASKFGEEQRKVELRRQADYLVAVLGRKWFRRLKQSSALAKYELELIMGGRSFWGNIKYRILNTFITAIRWYLDSRNNYEARDLEQKQIRDASKYDPFKHAGRMLAQTSFVGG